MKTLLRLLPCFLFLFFACRMEEEMKEVTVKDRYAISLPTFLDTTNALNKDASLQYQHLQKEFYVLVIDERKEELRKAIEENGLDSLYGKDLQGYTDLILNSMKESLSNPTLSPIRDTTISQLPAKVMEMDGTIEKIDIHYNIAILEGRSRYYQVLSWTLKSKTEEHKPMMDKIRYSFREL